MKRTGSFLVIVLLVVVTAGALALIFLTEPTAQREGATRESAMLVDVTEVTRSTYHPVIEAMGTVEAERDIVLRPRVAGEVLERSEGFTPGGFVARGEILLRLDPADYETALAEARSELHQAEADLALEQGRQDVARQDFALLERELEPENRALVLREPQLQTARARVEAAQAAVRRAELDLERTTIRAPFDAHILAREVDIGSQVSPGDALARLVGVDTYWVVAAVPLSKLHWIRIPDTAGADGASVRIRHRSAWPEGAHREGRVYQLLGELAQQTRMARVLVAVEDPLARREAGDATRPPLMLGTYVQALIDGRTLEGVVRLDRDYLRKNDTVWVMEDNQLSIREPEIVFRDATHAYISRGLEDGDRVVTTNLSTVLEGAALRTEADDSPPVAPPEEEGPAS